MGKNFAITIGINGYRYLQQLNYAKHDAESMQAFFLQDLDFDQVYHFSDNSPPIKQDFGPDLDSYPSFTTLDRFLQIRFKESFLREGDNLWFFFAGHGVRYEDQDYLMPIDAYSGNVKGTAIPLHYITERLRRCGADNVVLLIDACRSRAGKRDGVGIGEEQQQGVITLFSCSPHESSYEIEELQQGAFTYALLESLRLQGEENCSTVERLYKRLRNRVPELSQRYQKPQQTPYGVVEPLTKNHLILLPQQATQADIMTLKNDALSAEVKQAFQQAKQLWIRVLAVFPAEPKAIEAIERLARVSISSNLDPPRKPQPSHENEDGIYTKLRDALAVGDWKQADRETYRLMLHVVNRKPADRSCLRQKEVPKLSCNLLRTIDELWIEHSKNQFGFTVQQEIWRDVGGKVGNFNYEVFCEFANRVGWKTDSTWSIRKYRDFLFSLEARKGHLPSLACEGLSEINWWHDWSGGFRNIFPHIGICLQTRPQV